ncbi:hypothetical protein MPTK1_6g20150 [Marchantia polymorpha subsp. ruderalis]|uniref:Uncharacterized protein n=2 Tax=Marchantia polymorpha TaxID=3197 RepID=A0AAF6BU25_MARPO|nr:hypothetical protein MARPO_0045s0049 [Marchantia polymorpha]BBN15509.1 hypothetical protein Mp_6g20150 [Marchantia polymorpha subsp. ruderalis]|eukprot:PTQ39380.1 hypothetical protein MARPO_0045s0049 [Marchantia polymorpha]
MALIWTQGETIVMVKRASRTSTQIHVVAAEWDSSNDCFVLSGRIVISVAADAELLTGGSVLDSETGLLRSYVVLGRAESIYIWCLDFEQARPDLVVKLPLPNSSSISSKTSGCSVKDCWLVDGPIVVAVWKGQLLLVTSKASYGSTEFSAESEDPQGEIFNTPWEAHVLCSPQSSEQLSLKVQFCGDVARNESQVAIISFTASSGKRPRTCSVSNERYLQSWSYYNLILDPEVPIAHEQSSTGSGLKFIPSKQIPVDLDPRLISCIQPVTVVPSTNGDDSDYIFVGTKDKRLLRYRCGQLVDVTHLDAIPSQLNFGVVAGGQGVLLVVLDDLQQKVLAVCPESLQVLQDWSKVWHVVIGDFVSSGYDQIVLLHIASASSAEEGLSSPGAQLELNFTVIHGFSTVTCEGLQQGTQRHLAETKVINDCKLSGMDTICKALQDRVEAGLSQLQVARNERESKGELVRISSCLMQNMVTRWAHEEQSKANVEGKSGTYSVTEQGRLELVRATSVWSRVCGTNWFLMVEIEMTPDGRPDVVLHHVSLLLSSQNCSIGGKSSVLKSHSFGDKRATLVVCIPYHEFSLRPRLPFNISVRAKLPPGHESVRTSESCDPARRTSGDVYTQWLGSSEVVYLTSAPTLKPKEACTLLEQVGEQVQFVIGAKSEEHLLQLSAYMQSALRMHELPDDKQERENTLRWFNLCSADGHGPYVANLCFSGLHGIIRLRSVDADLLAGLEQTSVELFTQHRYEILSRIIPHEALEKLDSFIKTLRKHLAVQNSLMQRGHESSSKESRLVALKLDRAVDERFSEIWASLI